MTGLHRAAVDDDALLSARGLALRFGAIAALDGVDAELWPGEVLAVVGESGSGKTTLLNVLSGRIRPDAGIVEVSRSDRPPAQCPRHAGARAAGVAPLRLGVRAAEPARRPAHGRLRRRQCRRAADGAGRAPLRLDPRRRRRLAARRSRSIADRIDDLPRTFSGGMLQRLQIARTLVTHPRLVFMDEPTGGLDVSVQARLLDLIRGLVARLHIAVVLVTHDLAVARLLAQRIMVMQRGRVVETGLTDQVLDDPHHPYTQLLVSSVLAA